MSDRTPSSVRTGGRTSDAPEDTAAARSGDRQPEVSATQAIPTTGAQRAQGGDTVATPPPAPAGPTAPGASAGAPADAGRPPGAPIPAAGPAPGRRGTPADAGRPAAPADAGPPAAPTPAARPATPVGAPRPGSVQGAPRAGAKPGGKATRGPRRARLQLRHVDIWSAFKISFVLSIALFFIWMVAIGILYLVLSGLGVFSTVNDLFGQLGNASGGKHTGNVVTPGIVLGGAAVIGAVNVILMTALCTVGTFIYNMCSDLVGGLEVTLSERD